MKSGHRGKLHNRLVELPWVDILTTNWDTLLERAAVSVIGQTYETVRSLEDIATTRAPRIVKLHGSLPSNRPFIFSEEDYRTYPRLFAPFVNLVQQVLLENELCLVGFSGMIQTSSRGRAGFASVGRIGAEDVPGRRHGL